MIKNMYDTWGYHILLQTKASWAVWTHCSNPKNIEEKQLQKSIQMYIVTIY